MKQKGLSRILHCAAVLVSLALCDAGTAIVRFVIGSDDWNARVAKSKFADWKYFAKYRKGHVGLQDHGHRVWFRNIRLREL